MAYNADNLALIESHAIGGFWKEWCYKSADATATVAAAGYISDALKKGMKQYDLVYVLKTDTGAMTIHRVTAVASTGATLSAGLSIT